MIRIGNRRVSGRKIDGDRGRSRRSHRGRSGSPGPSPRWLEGDHCGYGQVRRNYVDDVLSNCRMSAHRVARRRSVVRRRRWFAVPGRGIRRTSRADGDAPRIDMYGWDVTSRGVASKISQWGTSELSSTGEDEWPRGREVSARWDATSRGETLAGRAGWSSQPDAGSVGAGHRTRRRGACPRITFDRALCRGAFRLYSEWEGQPCRFT
jgi:hypothetical protein